MKFNIYSIRDSYTGFMTPVIEINDQAAKRNFDHAVHQDGSLMNSHPQDYDLYRIGEFDADSGVIVPEIPPVVICAASSLEV